MTAQGHCRATHRCWHIAPVNFHHKCSTVTQTTDGQLQGQARKSQNHVSPFKLKFGRESSPSLVLLGGEPCSSAEAEARRAEQHQTEPQTHKHRPACTAQQEHPFLTDGPCFTVFWAETGPEGKHTGCARSSSTPAPQRPAEQGVLGLGRKRGTEQRKTLVTEQGLCPQGQALREGDGASPRGLQAHQIPAASLQPPVAQVP